MSATDPPYRGSDLEPIKLNWRDLRRGVRRELAVLQIRDAGFRTDPVILESLINVFYILRSFRMTTKESVRWARGVPSLPVRKWNDSRNKFWVSRHGFEHTEYMPLGDSPKKDGWSPDSNPHQLVWLTNLNYAVKQTRRFVGLEQFSFLDLGCGTGVPSIYAHMVLGFRTAGGFDIDERFVKWANENAERVGLRSKVSFQEADASEFVLLDDKYFLFFFNSFGEATLTSFLSKNRDSLERHNSVLCLVNDLAAAAVFALPNVSLLFRNPKRNLSVFQFGGPVPE